MGSELIVMDLVGVRIEEICQTSESDFSTFFFHQSAMWKGERMAQGEGMW